MGFSIVSHSYIEQLCSIAVSHARTKDLVWLVYRHTAGKNKGQAGPPWTVTSGSLRASLQIARSTLQRCLSEAADLGLITASREGYLWSLNIDPNRPACGSTGPSAGHFEKQTGPPAGQDGPSAGQVGPSAGQLNPSAGQLNPSAGSIRGAAPPLIKEKKNKIREVRKNEQRLKLRSSEASFLFDLKEGTITEDRVIDYLETIQRQREQAKKQGDRERMIDLDNREARTLRAWGRR